MRPEVAKYQPQIDVLIGFAEGRLDVPALDTGLGTREMRSLLKVFMDRRDIVRPDYLQRLLEEDRDELRGLVNIEGTVEEFLEVAEVPCRAAQRYGTAFSLFLAAVPRFVDPPLEFVTERIISFETILDGTMSPNAKKKLIRERIKEQFRYVDKPPRWVQDPDWPIQDGKPLLFVGQIPIDASELFHDRGAAYVFYNPDKGCFETVAQFC